MKKTLHIVSRSLLTASMLAGMSFSSHAQFTSASDVDSTDAGQSGSSQTGTQPGCNNPYDVGKACRSCIENVMSLFYAEAMVCPAEGPNKVNLATNSVHRAVRDMVANGGVGGHRLNWTRFGQSRLVTGLQHFGDGHVWRHTYQWEFVEASATAVYVTEPDGSRWLYNKSGAVWVAETPTNANTLTQTGNDYFLNAADGSRVHFEKLGSGTVGDPFYYQMQDFNDGFGQTYFCSYNASKKLALVSEPGGRWLRVNYQDITVNQSDFKTLATITAVPPGGWNELPVSDTTAYRFLRYTSSQPGEVATYCMVNELEFRDMANVKINGTPFGASPSRNNDPNKVFTKAFDGNLGNAYEYAYQHYGFAGIDLGAGNAQQVSKVRFVPPGIGARMLAGRFQGSNVAPIMKNVIASVEIGYGAGAGEVITNAVNYTYDTLPDPVIGTDWLLLRNATYGDATQAKYSYQIIWPGQRPLLKGADDPRVSGNATKILYEFWRNGYIHGSLYAERDYASQAMLAKFEGVGTNNYTNTGRKVTYANGSTKEYSIGAFNRVNWMKDALGRQVTFAFKNNNSFINKSTDPTGRITNYTRDGQGRLLTATMPDGSVRTWTRNAKGHVLTEKDELNRTTTYTRDAQNRVTRIDHPDASYETFTYNAFGQPLTHRMQNGGTETNTYDAAGRLLTKTDAVGYVTTFTHGADDRVASVTRQVGNSSFATLTTSLTYNDRGQTTAV